MIIYYIDIWFVGTQKKKLIYMLNKVFSLNEEANTFVTRFLRRFYNSQFKRQTLPDGPKVLKLGLSPRADIVERCRD